MTEKPNARTTAKKTTAKRATTKKATTKSAWKGAAKPKAPARKKTVAKKAQAKKPAATAPAKEVTKAKSQSKPAPAPMRRPSGLDLAATVLREAGEPLNAKAIAERAIEAGWATRGKTPHATLYAAMVREISRKGAESRFRKSARGLFTHA